VIAIIFGAAWRIGGKTLRNAWSWSLAVGAWVGLVFLHVPFPVLVLLAGIVGWMVPARFPAVHKASATEPPALTSDIPAGWGRALRITAVCLALWWLPVLAVALFIGKDSVQMQMSWFFSKAAMVTFGGAYAVLPYVSQQAVETFHWLQPGQMLDGLGLAETTPGPLIMVLQFVGFVGAWQNPGALTPFWSATLGAALTTWVTFLPCFLWIFLGAPYVENLRNQPRFASALSAITAAVVGIMANMALWFAWHVCVPEAGRVDWFAVVLAVAALVALQRFKWGVITVVLAAAAIGGLRVLLGL
jgi:chromate transporter